MLKLKEMSWSDNWEDYIKYRKTNVSEEDKWNNHRNIDTPFMFQIVFVMTQLEDKMSVYDAFLKGLEAYYSSTTCGKESFLQEYRKLQNKIYKNIKKGVVDEFLLDVHCVMINAITKRTQNK